MTPHPITIPIGFSMISDFFAITTTIHDFHNHRTMPNTIHMGIYCVDMPSIGAGFNIIIVFLVPVHFI